MEDAATGHERSLSSNPPDGEGGVVSRLPDFHDKLTYAAWPDSETRTTLQLFKIERIKPTMTHREQAQLRIHKILSEEPGISLRQLAVRLGISPGKIN